MPEKPSYGLSLAATILGGIAASIVMVVPSWLWAKYVLDVPFDSIVGRAAGLATGDRVLLYGGNLVLICLGFAVYALLTRSLYSAFQGMRPNFWDTFFALIATGIAAAIVGYFFPFVGLLVAIFMAPAAVNSTLTYDAARLADAHADIRRTSPLDDVTALRRP
jgi:hypothetical protein